MSTTGDLGVYSERMTSLPSPFGSAKSGAFEPTLSVLPEAAAAGTLGGASGDWPDCASAVRHDTTRIKAPKTAFIICGKSSLRRERLSMRGQACDFAICDLVVATSNRKIARLTPVRRVLMSL